MACWPRHLLGCRGKNQPQFWKLEFKTGVIFYSGFFRNVVICTWTKFKEKTGQIFRWILSAKAIFFLIIELKFAIFVLVLGKTMKFVKIF